MPLAPLSDPDDAAPVDSRQRRSTFLESDGDEESESEAAFHAEPISQPATDPALGLRLVAADPPDRVFPVITPLRR